MEKVSGCKGQVERYSSPCARRQEHTRLGLPYFIVTSELEAGERLASRSDRF
jgi:hypothetical protein